MLFHESRCLRLEKRRCVSHGRMQWWCTHSASLLPSILRQATAYRIAWLIARLSRAVVRFAHLPFRSSPSSSLTLDVEGWQCWLQFVVRAWRLHPLQSSGRKLPSACRAGGCSAHGRLAFEFPERPERRLARHAVRSLTTEPFHPHSFRESRKRHPRRRWRSIRRSTHTCH